MSAFGVKRPSLAALTKVPNPLEAEEEAEQYGKIPHKIGLRPQQNHIPPRPRQRIAPDRMFHDRMMILAWNAFPSCGCSKRKAPAVGPPGRVARLHPCSADQGRKSLWIHNILLNAVNCPLGNGRAPCKLGLAPAQHRPGRSDLGSELHWIVFAIR